MYYILQLPKVLKKFAKNLNEALKHTIIIASMYNAALSNIIRIFTDKKIIKKIWHLTPGT
jgi:hypothetical protein